MKNFTLIFLLFSTILFAQKEKSSIMGQTTLDELKMTVYDKDSTAAAVVLYEHANRYPNNSNDQIPTTDYYFRIKILDKTSFNLANIAINLYDKQKISNIKAVTYNLTGLETINKTNLSDKDIFTLKDGEKWRVKKFTLPNIKVGSVIEYSYTIASPYLSINDWYFQSDIPKIKSELDVAILGNYLYNIKLVGFLKLDKDQPSIKKKCVYVSGIGDGGCALYSYGMYNVPAFKEETYMLSKKNYISRLTFDLKSRTSYRGDVENLATTWKEADKSLKKQFFNNQTSKKSYFKKRIPEEILQIQDTLEKAKKIFNFIRNHYTWNQKYWTNEDATIKDAFEEKSGDVGEINISLYNSLQAADIKAKLMVLSTRNNGLPTKLFPVIYDYNYVIVKIDVDKESYFLDATNKFLPFGQIPTKTLNGEARLIDFTEESTWLNLEPKINSSKNLSAKLTLNNDGNFTGELSIRYNGYFASEQREIISLTKEDRYLENFESKNPDLEIDSYEVKNLLDLEKSLTEVFQIKLNSDELANKTRIYLVLFDRLKENPFKLSERNYPVDFAYTRKKTYTLNVTIPENYTITQVPKNIAIALPNNGGIFILKTISNANVINVYAKISINKKTYAANEYLALKEFYNQIIIAENAYIILEKN